ncbi:putative efflux protein, MATE family [Sanguibacter gelidistatuariae]|uniref:Putative efflux protein, MATE family n=1 Tax=Sanguibacter gelidistatuariae TaxID=1814289 RepID=A0A1G6H4T4_9MICO|nr:MATE family efflux transporter [Sanguibacter gelidistatuariae]SDB89108.1 putative efflux protein, MATE family [Sanguibacter gelidistatuariae]
MDDRSARHHSLDDRSARRATDRQILALAVPALGALVAEPIFVLVDSAVVGHLGTTQLAGLSVASTLLLTVVGLCVFLAYATTASVARRLGAGQRTQALQAGVDGMWLAAGLGITLAAALWIAAPWAIGAMGADGAVAVHAISYLRWSTPGLPGMLVVLASTGVLRGLQDTRTPLWVAAGGAIANTVLNIALVYGAGMGIAGSGLGTALTQLGMAAVLAVVVVQGARKAGARLRPAAGGIWANARAGGPLLVRNLSLRLAILLTVFVATGLGAVNLAGYQVVNSVWGLAAFALDALAIAAQALIGHRLGAGLVTETRAILRRTLQWGVGAGALIGAIIAVGGWSFATLFTSDADVRVAITGAMVVAGVLMPLAGWTFVLDGVLIGAGDGRYLAWAGMATLVVYAPVALAVRSWAPDGPAGLIWLWIAFAGVFMLARALTTGLRARTDTWMVVGD